MPAGRSSAGGGGSAGADVGDSDYYEQLIARVDDTLEQSGRRSSRFDSLETSMQVESARTGAQQQESVFISGVKPERAFAFFVDLEALGELNPMLLAREVERSGEDGAGREFHELRVRVRALWCVCVPLSRAYRVRMSYRRDDASLEVGMRVRTRCADVVHLYSFEAEHGGTRVTDVIEVQRPRWAPPALVPTAHAWSLRRLKAVLEGPDERHFRRLSGADGPLLYQDL